MATAPKPETLPLDILFEDADILVVAKPAGQYVHPSPGHLTGTLVNAALAHVPTMAGVGSVERPGVVPRLDADTSGVMVLAKTQRAYLALRTAFESHTAVVKTYLAIVRGVLKPRKGTLETLIGRKLWDPKRMAVVPEGSDGKRAVTRWEVLGRNGDESLVEFTIETGRTHQIRVHAAHLGHPLVGDPLYGDAASARGASRTLLHAVQLSFPHPVTGRRLTFTAEPPDDMVYR